MLSGAVDAGCADVVPLLPNTNPAPPVAESGDAVSAGARVDAGTADRAASTSGTVVAAAVEAGGAPAAAAAGDMNGDAVRPPVAPVPTTPAFVAMLTLLNVAVSACCAGGADTAAVPNVKPVADGAATAGV
jgi:hypothetical protein